MFDFLTNPIGAILYAIKEMLISFAGWLFNGYFFVIGGATNSSYLSGSLDKLFGTKIVWNLVKDAHSIVVIPLAESILAFFMLVQLVKISQRIDATATLPVIKDIIILAVTYVIFHWLIVNSLGILTALFDEFNNLSSAFGSANPSDDLFSSAVKYDKELINDTDIGSAFLLVLCAALSFFVGIIAFVVTLVVSFARAFQLYVMAAFSPIPLSLLGFEETRQSGISFLKNFAATALAGVIMVFLLVAFPSILSSIVVAGTGNAATTAGSISTSWLMTKFLGTSAGTSAAFGVGIFAVFTTLAVTIFLLLGLVKSGAWAKEILGS
ncbi:type IV secretion system protein [Streptococcus uberis]